MSIVVIVEINQTPKTLVGVAFQYSLTNGAVGHQLQGTGVDVFLLRLAQMRTDHHRSRQRLRRFRRAVFWLRNGKESEKIRIRNREFGLNSRFVHTFDIKSFASVSFLDVCFRACQSVSFSAKLEELP